MSANKKQQTIKKTNGKRESTQLQRVIYHIKNKTPQGLKLKTSFENIFNETYELILNKPPYIFLVRTFPNINNFFVFFSTHLLFKFHT